MRVIIIDKDENEIILNNVERVEYTDFKQPHVEIYVNNSTLIYNLADVRRILVV